MTFKIADLISYFQEMVSEGYAYCDISLCERDETTPEFPVPACLTAQGFEEGGYGRVDWDEVEVVSEEEIIMNAWTDSDKKTYGADYIAKRQCELLSYIQSEKSGGQSGSVVDLCQLLH